jgi:hypothetical protein
MTPGRAIAISAIAAACALCCILMPENLGRLPFAVPLLLLLPGWALGSALFPGPHEPVRSFALAVGLSLALAVIVAVELGAAGHLSVPTLSLSTAAITTACAAVAVVRRRPAAAPAARRGPRRVGAGLGAAALVVIALAIVGGAVALARTPLPVPDDRGYTVMSVAPAAGPRPAAEIAITSEEARTRTFDLVLRVPGRAVARRPITVAPGARRVVRVPLDAVQGTLRAALVVPGGSEATPYRRVRVTIPLLPPRPPVSSATGEWRPE